MDQNKEKRDMAAYVRVAQTANLATRAGDGAVTVGDKRIPLWGARVWNRADISGCCWSAIAC